MPDTPQDSRAELAKYCHDYTKFAADGLPSLHDDADGCEAEFWAAIQAYVAEQVAVAEKQGIIDRHEWYCRGIGYVATDLMNGKSVELTLKRAAQRSQEWEERRKNLIKQLTTTPNGDKE